MCICSQRFQWLQPFFTRATSVKTCFLSLSFLADLLFQLWIANRHKMSGLMISATRRTRGNLNHLLNHLLWHRFVRKFAHPISALHQRQMCCRSLLHGVAVDLFKITEREMVIHYWRLLCLCRCFSKLACSGTDMPTALNGGCYKYHLINLDSLTPAVP